MDIPVLSVTCKINVYSGQEDKVVYGTIFSYSIIEELVEKLKEMTLLTNGTPTTESKTRDGATIYTYRYKTLLRDKDGKVWSLTFTEKRQYRHRPETDTGTPCPSKIQCPVEERTCVMAAFLKPITTDKQPEDVSDKLTGMDVVLSQLEKRASLALEDLVGNDDDVKKEFKNKIKRVIEKLNTARK